MSTATPNDLRVLIIASSPLARAGLAALLSDQPALNVVGQVAVEGDKVELATVYRPDVAVWDVGYEPLQHIDALSDLRDANLPVLALLADAARADELVPPLLGAGVRGVLPQETLAEALAAALHAVANNLFILDPAIATALLPAADTVPNAATRETLTPREIEVLNHIANGLPNKTIAGKLHISEHTVKYHVNAILTKLSAQSRTEAVVRATRLGLIAL